MEIGNTFNDERRGRFNKQVNVNTNVLKYKFTS